MSGVPTQVPSIFEFFLVWPYLYSCIDHPGKLSSTCSSILVVCLFFTFLAFLNSQPAGCTVGTGICFIILENCEEAELFFEFQYSSRKAFIFSDFVSMRSKPFVVSSTISSPDKSTARLILAQQKKSMLFSRIAVRFVGEMEFLRKSGSSPRKAYEKPKNDSNTRRDKAKHVFFEFRTCVKSFSPDIASGLATDHLSRNWTKIIGCPKTLLWTLWKSFY